MKRKLSTLSVALVLLFAATISPIAEPPPVNFSLFVVSQGFNLWDVNYSFQMDSTGAAAFYVSRLDSGLIDSSFTTLSAIDMEMLYDTVMEAGFFGLDTLYKSDVIDGDMVVLHVTAGGSSLTVTAINTVQTEINRIVSTLNAILAPSGIEIIYNALSDGSAKGGER